MEDKTRKNSKFSAYAETDYLELAELFEGRYLGPYPKYAKEKTNWLCKNNHRITKSFTDIKRYILNNINICSICVPRSKLESDYIDLANKLGIKFVGPITKFTHEKTNWKCEMEHLFERSFNQLKENFKRDSTICPICNAHPKPKLEEQDYFILATKLNIKFKGTVVNVDIKTDWECQKGHKIYLSYDGICSRLRANANANICKECVKNEWINKYKLLAEQAKLTLINGPPVLTDDKANWYCENNHLVKKSYNQIKRNVIDNHEICLVCKSLGYKFPEILIEWSGENLFTPYEISFGSIKQIILNCQFCNESYNTTAARWIAGRRHPYCKNKTEKLTGMIINDLFSDYQIYLSPKQFIIEITEKYTYFQISKNKKCRIDFALLKENLVIYIEYNGRQHYESIEIFGGESKFKHQQQRDQFLREYCKDNNILLYEIDGRKYFGEEKIRQKLEEIKRDIEEKTSTGSLNSDLQISDNNEAAQIK